MTVHVMVGMEMAGENAGQAQALSTVISSVEAKSSSSST